MSFEELFNNYLENSLLHKSKGTYDYERAKIKRLLRTLKNISITNIVQFDKSALNRLILGLKNEISNKTINKYLLILKNAYKINGLEFEYLQRFKKLRENKIHFDIIERNELKKILYHMSHLNSCIDNNLMYQTIIFLLLETGVRANELVNIEIKNIDLENRSILLTTTKTKKNRIVFFTGLSEKYIKKMINRKPIGRKKLLYNKLKNRESLFRDVKYTIDKIKKELKISQLHPHMFRHTFATLAYESGMDVFVLKELLGHENIETTMIYTHLSNQRLRTSYLDTFSKALMQKNE